MLKLHIYKLGIFLVYVCQGANVKMVSCNFEGRRDFHAGIIHG